MKRLVLILAALCLIAAGSAAFAGSATTLPGLRSPSGNIRRLFIPGSRAPALRLCTLARSDYAALLQARCMRPSGAGVDWHGFTLTATGRGAINCSGGILYNPATQRPGYATLPCGKSWRHGTFTCTSRVTGVTCRNRAGHGLFVSRQSWRVW